MYQFLQSSFIVFLYETNAVTDLFLRRFYYCIYSDVCSLFLYNITILLNLQRVMIYLLWEKGLIGVNSLVMIGLREVTVVLQQAYKTRKRRNENIFNVIFRRRKDFIG